MAQNQERSLVRDGSLFILQHGQQRVLVPRPASYDAALASARLHFRGIPRASMTLRTNKLEICEGKYVDITRESWDNVIGLISCISVFTSTPASEEKLTITVQGCNAYFCVKVNPTTKLQSLYTAISRRCHVPEIDLSLRFEGRTLVKGAIVAHSGLEDGSVVDVKRERLYI